MISFLRGIIHDVGDSDVIVEVGGVGYRVTVHPKAGSVLQKGETVFLYTHFVMREDMVQLFGFLTAEEQKFFRLLISASGIGPKTALTITGSASYGGFCNAVLTGDISTLVRLPGVGKKTAQRILVELKDKVSQLGLTEPGSTASPFGIADAREALNGLGFSASEVEDLLQKAVKEKGMDADSDVLIKYVLQQLGS